MRKFFKLVQKDSVLTWSFWITIICIVVMVGMIGLLYTNLPPFIPLYNNMPWGYARLGNTFELFLLPLSISAIYILNMVIGIKLMEKVPLLARFLFLTTISLAIFTSIFVGRLIFLVL